MSQSVDDPHCPECGEPIGQTATYCMHCSADLAGRGTVSGDAGGWSRESSASTTAESIEQSADEQSDQLLHPEGLVDNTLTVIVGIVGGIIIGILGTAFMLGITGSLWGFLLGFGVWLGATGYLVRRYTVQTAVAHSFFGIALVFLLMPLIAFSPWAPIDNGLSQRLGIFISGGIISGIFAVVAGTIGGLAYIFVPDDVESQR